VALAMRDHPDLARMMQSDFGQLAELRLRQAAVEADVQMMQAITTQFHSTTAAAEAEVWLGDRALATGDLRRAEAFYRAAWSGIAPAAQPHLAARLRLAAAMNGRRHGEPVATDVRLGDVEIPAAAFERLVRDTLAGAGRESADVLSAPQTAAAVEQLPPPAVYEAVPRARQEAIAGRDPAAFPRRDLDLLGAQTAVVLAAPHLIVNSRFSLAAFDADTGRRAWQRTMDFDQGRTYAWPLVTFRPVVTGPVTLARRLAGWGPELVCLETVSGELRWRSPRNEIVASDPLVLADRIVAVTLSQAQQDVLQLLLTSYDPRSGAVISQQPIVQMRDVWSRELPLAAHAVGDTVLISGGGCIIGCDLEGTPRWLRRQTWLTGVNDRGPPVRFDPPLVDGDRAIVVQPGVPTITCVEIATGQLVWQRVLPDNSRHLRLFEGGGDRVAVQAGEQLLCYARATGELLWRQFLPGVCEAATIDAQGNLLLALAEKTAAKLYGLRLAWLDGASGAVRDTSSLRSWSGEQPWLGPWALHQGRIFALSGGEPIAAPTARELIELRPLDSATVVDADRGDGPPAAAPGLLGVNRVLPALPATFAGWTVLQSSGNDERPAALRAESDGRRNVFQTVASAARPLYLARRVEAAAAQQTLRLSFTTPNNSTAWRLEVLWNDRVLHAHPPEKQRAAGSYQTAVEVPAEAGWLFVILRHDGGGSTIALWERLTVE